MSRVKEFKCICGECDRELEVVFGYETLSFVIDGHSIILDVSGVRSLVEELVKWGWRDNVIEWDRR